MPQRRGLSRGVSVKAEREETAQVVVPRRRSSVGSAKQLLHREASTLSPTTKDANSVPHYQRHSMDAEPSQQPRPKVRLYTPKAERQRADSACLERRSSSSAEASPSTTGQD